VCRIKPSILLFDLRCHSGVVYANKPDGRDRMGVWFVEWMAALWVVPKVSKIVDMADREKNTKRTSS
jgi:hypothetical protein